jgi:2-keto-3-deoxy-L-rhamnonate aldolase RhmA
MIGGRAVTATQSIIPNAALRRLRAGEMALGFGVHHLRTAATPMLAKAGGYDFLFIDTEHGAFSIQEATQMCLAALPVGITPLVRVCADALDVGTRALDNGAQGIVVPHVDTAAQARRVADAFRFPSAGNRSWGGPPYVYNLRGPAIDVAQGEINRETLIVAMIETPEAVANADAIAAVEGIDVLLFGTSDLTTTMGIAGQIGHARVQEAYRSVAAVCRERGKVLGMGGVYDETYARTYLALGARFVLGGSDHQFLLEGGSARAKFLRGLV